MLNSAVGAAELVLVYVVVIVAAAFVVHLVESFRE